MGWLAATGRQLGLSASARSAATKPPRSGGLLCRHALHSRRLTHASAAVDERGGGGSQHSAVDAAGNIVPAPLLSQASPLASIAASTAAVNASAERHLDGPPVVATNSGAVAPPPPAAAAHSGTDDFCGEEGLEGEHFEHGVGWRSLDEMHETFEHEMVTLNENLNQAVHTAIEQEMTTFNQALEQAVETALDRSFDIKANFNTIIALTGVILFWRGCWNLLDTFLGTDNSLANLGSLLIGLSIMLLFRILRLPLAEFW